MQWRTDQARQAPGHPEKGGEEGRRPLHVFEGTQAAYLPLYGADDALHVVAEAVAELVAEQMAPNVDDESGSRECGLLVVT